MTRRERVLAHLAEHPGLSTHEIAQALDGGRGGQYLRLLTDMQRKGQLLLDWQPRNGHRRVRVWLPAPPGTKPVLITDPDREKKRVRDRAYKRRQRARNRGEDPETAATRQPWRRLNLPVSVPVPGQWRDLAACRGEDPDLFFSFLPADIMKAQQVCAGCPVKVQCAYAAEANGEEYGVWAGIDRDPRHQAEQIAS